MKSRRQYILFVSCLLALLCVRCVDGGQCAANGTVLTDIDADCVEDSSDNCIYVSDPESSYNPDQFDGDDDGIGVPCDIDDTDDSTV